MKAIPFFLFVLLSYSTYSQQTATLDQSLSKAKEEHKKVLFFFSGSDWCSPCVRFKKNYIDNPSFKEFTTTNLILFNADFPKLKKNSISNLLPKRHFIWIRIIYMTKNTQSLFPKYIKQ